MSPVRFALLVLALASTRTTAFAQLAILPCAVAGTSGHACSTAQEQTVEAKLVPQNMALSTTEDHFTGKERDTESSNAPNALIKVAAPGLNCIYANDAGNRIKSIDHISNATECGNPRSGGTLVPGYVSEDHTAYNRNTGQFQVTSYDDGKVHYAKFAAGARSQANGTCATGCAGYVFATADAAWLSSMIVGGNLDQLMTFLVNQDVGIHGIFGPSDPAAVMQVVCGPLEFWNDHWAGPDGMGAPTGRGDWAAIVHDYNYDTNHVTVSMYFNPFISRASSRAIVRSNNKLIRNSGGFQGVKMGLFFGTINSFQWLTHAL